MGSRSSGLKLRQVDMLPPAAHRPLFVSILLNDVRLTLKSGYGSTEPTDRTYTDDWTRTRILSKWRVCPHTQGWYNFINPYARALSIMNRTKANHRGYLFRQDIFPRVFSYLFPGQKSADAEASNRSIDTRSIASDNQPTGQSLSTSCTRKFRIYSSIENLVWHFSSSPRPHHVFEGAAQRSLLTAAKWHLCDATAFQGSAQSTHDGSDNILSFYGRSVSLIQPISHNSTGTSRG